MEPCVKNRYFNPSNKKENKSFNPVKQERSESAKRTEGSQKSSYSKLANKKGTTQQTC
ncbi:hypothetical protein SLEP1_g34259 [Rubroshorea leprosula]|uniref:Uncharacterized protein n=1 Tax=Rubroshorea leprosula TaxID=152421 RepID=A0AAV5KJ83_9ROSI|nr:hypothetical protein SLEP1_g34259 [Rubroshorea leprosula]